MRFSFPDGELDIWAALGDVTERSVRVWLRQPTGATETARVVVEGTVLAEAEITPDPAHDFVGAAVLEIAGAAPGSPFRVDVAGMVRTGRLAPAAGEAAAFSFGFGSCHQPFEQGLLGDELTCHEAAPIYDHMREQLLRDDARFLLLVGDQVYADGVAAASVRERLDEQGVSDQYLADVYRHLYRGYFNESGFRRLQETFPAYLTWDDHDIFDGWGSQLDPQPFDRRLFDAAHRAYREYQVLRNPGGTIDASPPHAYPFWYGDVGFFVLDLRGRRSYQEGRILGDEQWRLFDAFLDEASGRGVSTVMIVASVPVAHLSPGLIAATDRVPGSKGTDIRDRWNTPVFRHEREALLERCFAWRAGGPRRQVVLLGGDVHVGAAFSLRPKRATGWSRGTIHQWTSSAMTTPGGLQHRLVNAIGTALVNFGEPSLVLRRRGLDGRNNFGVVRVEPMDGGGHLLRFTLHEYDARRRRMSIPFSVGARPRP